MKDVKDFEGLYSVNEAGQVFSHAKTVGVGSNGGVRHQALQELRPTKPSKKTNHLRVYLAKQGKKYPRLVHRLVADAFLENLNGLPFVNHKDGNPENNHVTNLEWCTERENSLHAYQFGLWKPPMQKGASNSNSKLTEQDVRQIRERHANGESSASIASDFGINPKTASMIVLRQRWAHVA